MIEFVKKELEKESQTGALAELLTSTLAQIKRSRQRMSDYYSDWDLQDDVFRGLRYLDEEDREQVRREKPTKMIVPHTYAQVMTATSFLFLLFGQNENFWEVKPTGDEDYDTKRKDMELLLEHNRLKNDFNLIEFQSLLDTFRFGSGIVECSWCRDTTWAKVGMQPEAVVANGLAVETYSGSEWQQFTKYEGNRYRSVSPYRFFPDTSHPLVDFQKGNFCAAEEEFTMGQLRDLEAAGEVAGVDRIEPLPRNFDNFRGAATRTAIDLRTITSPKFDVKADDQVCIVTKVQRRIVPSKFEFDNKKTLGPETHQVLYHLWIANDNRIIRAEPAAWWHNEFGWAVSQFTPDMHQTLSMGLADLVYRLQDVISWLINSHIRDVRRCIGNRLIIDPKIVDTKTLDGEGDIYLRKGVSVPLDRAVGQLTVRDVTSGHMQDQEVLARVMEVVTGISGNMMGQYSSGRRSARQTDVVTSGAAGRMKMHAHLIWSQCFGKLGGMSLSNLRQNLQQPYFNRVIGSKATPERFAAFKGTPEEVICGDDYMIFDSTLQSEKAQSAQALVDLLGIILPASPLAAQRLGLTLDPMKMIDESMYLKGAGNVSRFALTPEQVQQQMQMMVMAQQQQAAQTSTVA